MQHEVEEHARLAARLAEAAAQRTMTALVGRGGVVGVASLEWRFSGLFLLHFRSGDVISLRPANIMQRRAGSPDDGG